MNHKSPKDPKSILILTMKLLLIYFWKTLPIGALISLAPISLAFFKSSQIGPSSSNHLKIIFLGQRTFPEGSLVRPPAPLDLSPAGGTRTDGGEAVDGGDGGGEGQIRLGEQDEQRRGALCWSGEQREGAEGSIALRAEQLHHAQPNLQKKESSERGGGGAKVGGVEQGEEGGVKVAPRNVLLSERSSSAMPSPTCGEKDSSERGTEGWGEGWGGVRGGVG